MSLMIFCLLRLASPRAAGARSLIVDYTPSAGRYEQLCSPILRLTSSLGKISSPAMPPMCQRQASMAMLLVFRHYAACRSQPCQFR